MEVSSFGEIEAAFLERIQRMVWCNVATIDSVIVRVLVSCTRFGKATSAGLRRVAICIRPSIWPTIPMSH